MPYHGSQSGRRLHHQIKDIGAELEKRSSQFSEGWFKFKDSMESKFYGGQEAAEAEASPVNVSDLPLSL